IKQALEMPKQEQTARMRKLRDVISANDIYRWATKFVTEVAKTKGLR
ncbi:MAG: trehalose-6-phosphate synthase, partial [Candidatus Omnitrophica bacterium]|nr:trehalose-6-phosphate synthase [Candidatus Omnitrophota bacterium]